MPIDKRVLKSNTRKDQTDITTGVCKDIEEDKNNIFEFEFEPNSAIEIKVEFKHNPVMEPYIPQELPFSSAQFIIYEVALKHGITIQDIKNHSHKRKFVEARQEAAYLMQSQLKLSLPMIGRVIGKRDHTTILHAIRRYKAKIVSCETLLGE